jgi:hypothetical protein
LQPRFNVTGQIDERYLDRDRPRHTGISRDAPGGGRLRQTVDVVAGAVELWRHATHPVAAAEPRRPAKLPYAGVGVGYLLMAFAALHPTLTGLANRARPHHAVTRATHADPSP